MANGDGAKACMACCCLLFVPISFTLILVLVAAYADFTPVEVTVEEATLGRLALAAPPAAGSNGTTPAAASLSYNLSLAVAVRNPNWAIRVWRTAPLDAELRLVDAPFALVRLAGAEEERVGSEELIGPKRSAVYRAVAAAESAPLALGSDGQAAELAVDSRTGMFRLELVVAGEVRYQAHPRRRSVTVRCPLSLPLSTAPAVVAFARFEHMLPPQACVYV